MTKKVYEYDIQQIDAWPSGDSSRDWSWNESWSLGMMRTRAEDVQTAFTNWLRNHGIVHTKGATRVVYDGDAYVMELRATDEPLFACIPLFYE